MFAYAVLLYVASVVMMAAVYVGWRRDLSRRLRLNVAIYAIATSVVSIGASMQPALKNDTAEVRDTVIGVVFSAMVVAALQFYGVFVDALQFAFYVAAWAALVASSAYARARDIVWVMKTWQAERVYTPIVDAPSYAVPSWMATFVR